MPRTGAHAKVLGDGNFILGYTRDRSIGFGSRPDASRPRKRQIRKETGKDRIEKRRKEAIK